MAALGVALDLAIAALVGVVRAHGTATGQYLAEGPWATLAFVVLVGGPGLLGIVGLRTRRPDLFGAAGVPGVLLSPISIVVWPLVVPSVLLLISFARHPIQSLGRTALTVTCFLVGSIAAFAVLLNMEPYSYSSGSSGDSGSYVPPSHAWLAIGLVLAGAFASTAVATHGPSQ